MKTITGFILCVTIIGFFACNRNDDDSGNKPVAKFSVSGYENPIPAPVTFINISQNATGFEWSFGDGTTSTQSNPTHSYTLRGTYQVRLKVTGPGGADSVCKLLTVETPAPTNKSVFSYYQEKCVGTPVGISFKTINPASTNPVWDFGNGSFGLERDPIVQYLLPGDYTIKYSTQFGSIRDTVIRIIRID
ncbi:MAG: PKD domain-containing protein [Chitinophagaceae bacterium]|nr:PKD domain-containing protein [Chitinophagaceae bacterium]